MVLNRMLGSLLKSRRPFLSALYSPNIAMKGFSTVSADDHIVGIYLGNKYSRIATMIDQYPQMIESEMRTVVSSYIALNSDKRKPVLVGEAAKYEGIVNPSHMFYNIKALFDRKLEDIKSENLTRNLPFNITKGPNGVACIEARGELLSTDSLCSFILAEIKRAAEDYLLTKEFKSLVGVPVCFSSDQRAKLMTLAEMAGFNVIGLVDEPVLAACANTTITDGVIVVFHMGSTSFSVSVLHASDGNFKVKESFTDSALGGDNFDRVLLDYYVEQMEKIHSVDISKDELNMRWLKEEVKRVKYELSSSRLSFVVISTINTYTAQPIHAKIALHRTNYEQLVRPLTDTIRSKCKTFLKNTDVTSVDQVILYGGMCRVPVIQKVVSETLKKSPVMKIDPANSVAVGAVLQALLMIDEKRNFLPSMLPVSIGMEVVGGIFKKVIPRLTSLPTAHSVPIITPSWEAQNIIVRIFMGERRFCASNIYLGELIDIEKHLPPKLLPKQIRVVFRINTDKVLSVCVVDYKGLMWKSVEIPLAEKLAKICPMKALKSAVSNYEEYQDALLPEVRNKGLLAMRRFENVLRVKCKYMKPGNFEGQYELLEDLVGALKSDDHELIKVGIDLANSEACYMPCTPLFRKRDGLSDYFDTSSSDSDSGYYSSDYYR